MKAISNFFTLRSFGRFMFDMLIFFFIFAAAMADKTAIPQAAYSQLCDSKEGLLPNYPLMHAVCLDKSKKQ